LPSSSPYIVKVGNLNSVRTYAHLDDAIRAYWLVATKGIPGEVYNIGGDYTCNVGDALNILIHKSIIPDDLVSIKVVPGRLRPTDITLQIPDCTKFKELTGWKPIKTIDDIAEDLLDYWRSILH
jgi:nucleoside-diphosphate-sugar epimerase